ncbi:MAG: aminotransferase class I/II-fold pyridoxal phosphate-dependent enzyme [Myxococcota bacterium]|nr:aminotransferase class I/II-fold pyridoxal phosphate-dependent enzyme [Myxococcota bacterium]
MTPSPIDLRSDTVTRPSAQMRRAMAEAEVGDDVYGEDPTVRLLEERTAQLLGLPAGLFVASGTLANQLAIGVLCRPGDEVISEAGSHCINFEGGAMAALWGVQPRALEGQRGMLTPQQVQAAVRPVNDHSPRSRLLALENTHNRGGGSVWPLGQYQQVVQAARAAGLSVHLDGARLFNAQVASGVPAAEFARGLDSATVCYSKGMGAPVGSVLCGSPEFISKARRLRKRLGGGMRQSGILAAAALHALDHNLQRLALDHAHARTLAQGLAELPGVSLALEQVETNMVFVETALPADEAVARLRREGVLCNPEGSGPNILRLVTHLDVSTADIAEAVARARRALAM